MIRRHLLPGITSGLQHARYFSLMTWVVGSYDVSGSRLVWRTYRRRVEHALRIAIKLANPDIKGLVGTESTPDLSGQKSAAVHSLEKQAPSSFEAQYYGASFDAVGLAKRPPGAAPQLTPLGLALFTAVEEELSAMPVGVRAAAQLLQSGPDELSTGSFERLSEFFQLRRVESDELEHEPLVSAVGGLETDGEKAGGDATKRARVFGLILALVDHRSTGIVDWRDILGTVCGPYVPSDIAEEFEEELEAWRCFGERQSERMALGAVWSAVFEWVESEVPFGLPVSMLLQRALNLLPEPRTSRSSVAEPYPGQDWGAFEDAVSKQAGGSRDQRYEYRQTLMSDLERSARAPLSAAERIRIALKLLALCMVTWRAEERAADMFAHGLNLQGGEARMSLSWLAEELGARRNQSVASVLRWLIERCVLDQLQRVGYAKGPGTTKLLLVREEETVLLAREGTVIHPFAQDTNRLGAALALLEGMSLATWGGAGCDLTPAGERFLEAVKQPV